jgi:hypothetical protein
VLEQKQPASRVGADFGVSERTVRKWLARSGAGERARAAGLPRRKMVWHSVRPTRTRRAVQVSGCFVTCPLCVWRLWVLLVIGLLVPACTAERPVTRSPSDVAEERAAADLPRGAIEVGEDLYQVPIGTDAAGCPMFRMYSPTKLVAQAIYYRDAAGGFTMSRQEAACMSARPD